MAARRVPSATEDVLEVDEELRELLTTVSGTVFE
jgi:hypothetical protein